MARTITATGTLAADEQFVLGTKIVGRLAEISVDLGSLVSRDQVIARIDPKDYQYRLDQAVAALKQARVRLGLPADGDDDRVDAKQTAVVRQARALLDQALLNRDRMARLWDQQLVARAELDAAVAALPGRRGPVPGRARGGPEPPGACCCSVARRSSWRASSSPTPQSPRPIDGAVVERQASVGRVPRRRARPW